MNISTSEKSLMVVVSSIVLLCIAVVYVKHHYLEQHYENCRYFARGFIEAPAECRREDCSLNDSTHTTERLEIPASFADNYLREYRRVPELAQQYYAAYLHCLESGESGTP